MTQWYEHPPLRPQQEFLILIGLWILGFVAGNLIAVPIWTIMTGQSVLEIESAMNNPKYASVLQVMQSVATFFTFLLPSWLTARIVSGRARTYITVSAKISFRKILIVVLIMFFAYMAAGIMAELMKAIPLNKSLKVYFDSFEKKYADAVSAMLQLQSFPDYLLSLLIIAFFPAVFEEVFFRGAMQNILIRWFRSPLIAILVTAFIFSSIHFSWYLLLARMALGMVLGYIFYYTGNLLYSIAGHFFNNGLALTIIYIQHLNGQKIDLHAEEPVPIWVSAVALPVVILLIVMLKRMGKTSETATSTHSVIENQQS